MVGGEGTTACGLTGLPGPDVLGSGWVPAGHSGSKDSAHMGHAPHTCRLRTASHLPALNRRLLTTTFGRDEGWGLSGLANKRQHWDLNPGLTSSRWPVSTQGGARGPQGRAKDVLSLSCPDLCAGRGRLRSVHPARLPAARRQLCSGAQTARIRHGGQHASPGEARKSPARHSLGLCLHLTCLPPSPITSFQFPSVARSQSTPDSEWPVSAEAA